MALAAAGDPKDAYTMGKITALEARATGVHWVYAPDSDVNNNPGNPIINTRSFGENPQRVAEFVSDRKSTRLNSSHSQISYAVFCLKKKKKTIISSRCACSDLVSCNVA